MRLYVQRPRVAVLRVLDLEAESREVVANLVRECPVLFGLGLTALLKEHIHDLAERLLASLARMGHSPLDDGGISNPASIRRLDLIIDTQRQMAASVANIAAETPATLEEWPAVELTRFVGRGAPRSDWHERWQAAGDAVGWEGAAKDAGGFPDWRMVALKGSPIWAALGNGVGGYRDTLGNPYPPFAYGSGLAWADVSRDEAIELGLIDPEVGRAVPGEPPEAPSLSPSDADIADAVSRLGFDADIFSDLAV